MRKYYIDNLRWISILLLFPYHTSMIYNTFGENFYIKGDGVPLLSGFIEICYLWYMPLLFVMAGISSCYALNKRTSNQYIKERIFKLLIPLIFGIALLVPIQTYFAEKFHNGYTGGYFKQNIMFFTKITDLTGYTGGFTPGHLWFILYLFIISIIAVPIMKKYQNINKKMNVSKLSILQIIPMFLLFLIMTLVLNIGGKSLGEYFTLFMLGYFVLSSDEVQLKLERNGWYLFIAFLSLIILNLIFIHVLNSASGLLYDIFSRFATWIGILSILGIGKKYLNYHNNWTDYFTKASFPIYIFHQSWLVLIAYYVFLTKTNIVAQVLLIAVGSFVATMITYEVFRRIIVTRFLFGITK